MKIKIKNKILLVSFIIFSVFCIFSFKAEASTSIYFEKENQPYFKGDILNVNLMVSSDKTLNAIDGEISYDKDILQIKKVNIKDSVLSLWVKEPIFDNQTGLLSFTGGKAGGFTGTDMSILDISFVIKKEINTTILFRDSFSIFLNDGKGTKVNAWMKPMNISFDNNVKNLKENKLGEPINIIYILVILFILLVYLLIKNKTLRLWWNKKNEK